MKPRKNCIRSSAFNLLILGALSLAVSASGTPTAVTEGRLVRGVENGAHLTAPAHVWLDDAHEVAPERGMTLTIEVNGERYDGGPITEVGHYFVDARLSDARGRVQRHEALYFRITDEPWHQVTPRVDSLSIVEVDRERWRLDMRLLVTADAHATPLEHLLPSSVKLFLRTIDGRNPIEGAVTLARGDDHTARLVRFEGRPIWRFDISFTVPRDRPAAGFELTAAGRVDGAWHMFHSRELPVWPLEDKATRWRDLDAALVDGRAVMVKDEPVGDGEPGDPVPPDEGDCDLLEKVTLITKLPVPAVDREESGDEYRKVMLLYPDYTKPILVFAAGYDEDGTTREDSQGGLGQWRWRIYPRNSEAECICKMTCQLAHVLQGRARYQEEDGDDTDEIAEVTLEAATGSASVCVTGAAIGTWTVKNSGGSATTPPNLSWFERFLKGLADGDNAWVPPLGGGLLDLLNQFYFFDGGTGKDAGSVNHIVSSMLKPNGTIGNPTGTANVCTVDFLNQWQAHLKYRFRGESDLFDDDAAAGFGYLEYYKHHILVHAKYKAKDDDQWKTKDFEHKHEKSIEASTKTEVDRWLSCAIAQQDPDPDVSAGASCGG